MGLKEDVDKDLQTYFDSQYEITDGRTIPTVDDIPLGPHGRRLDVTMLFVDIRESTKIVDAFRRLTAARMYKGFLYAVTKVARSQEGELRSFNGDGVLVVFAGDDMTTRAVRTAMNLVWVCNTLLKPKLDKYFENNKETADISFDFGIGLHTGSVLIVRGGIRGENNNDLVWVGNATNYAVKLSSAGSSPWHIHITQDVYNKMGASTTWKNSVDKTVNMWTWEVVDGESVLKTNYSWSL